MSKKPSSSKKVANLKSERKSSGRRLASEDFDAIDEFAAQRERVGLEESDIDSDEYVCFDEEAILNVPDQQDFDEEVEEEESEEETKIRSVSKKDKLSALKAKVGEKNKKQSANMKSLASKDNDSDEDILYDRMNLEGSDEEENATAVWGKNRKNYYAQDETSEAVEEEAQEARRIQKKKLSSLKFDDFIDENVDTIRGKSSKNSSLKKKIQFDDLADYEPNDIDMEELSESSESFEAEEMGDFLALLKDFKERLHLLKTQLVPLLQRAKESKLPTSSGLSFLQLKYHLMLAYCSSVVYYLTLKGRLGVVEGHPVIMRMLRYRLMIEKIRPLEIKMRFQIEKLLQPEGNESSFRPNPEDMEVDDDANDDSDAERADGKYRAPKLAPVHYFEDDKESAKTLRDEERRSRVASKSRLLAELRGELDDAPEEESIDPVRMASHASTDRRALEQEAYEEENFTRFQVSKKEKRRQEQSAKPLDELDDLDEFFGELEEINETVKGRSKKSSKKSDSIAAYLDQINQESTDNAKTAPSIPSAKYQGSDESDIEDDIQEEKTRNNRADQKREKRQEKLASQRESRGPVSYRPIQDHNESAPRPASYNIVKNKGLTPSRSKEQRNPRVKQRNRYEKAVKKLSSARGGRLSSDTSKPYAGETTGIRTNLTKSVRFK